MTQPDLDAVSAALATVHDPEINRPITDLGMLKSVEIVGDGIVEVGVYLTVSGCPMRGTIQERVVDAVMKVPNVRRVDVHLDVMNDEQRTALKTKLRGGAAKEIVFTQPGNTTAGALIPGTTDTYPAVQVLDEYGNAVNRTTRSTRSP